MRCAEFGLRRRIRHRRMRLALVHRGFVHGGFDLAFWQRPALFETAFLVAPVAPAAAPPAPSAAAYTAIGGRAAFARMLWRLAGDAGCRVRSAMRAGFLGFFLIGECCALCRGTGK